jgi:hypothetical protein
MNVQNAPKNLEKMSAVFPDGQDLNIGRMDLTVRSLTVPSSGSINRSAIQRLVGNRAKVGTTAGWTVGAANNIGEMATVAASQTAATLVVPIDLLKVGDTITAFKVVAQIESAGGAVTLDADLRAMTNAAADPTDASIGAITQVSVTADTAVDSDKKLLTEVVVSTKIYYVLLTATTAAATDIRLLGLTVTVNEV